MPQAVTHILIPIIVLSLVREKILSRNSKAHFPLHYVLIAGLAGGLPDVDILISIFLNAWGVSDWWVHKTFTHSFFFPACFLLLFGAFSFTNAKARMCNLGRHKLKLSLIFLMITAGTTIHLILDTFAGEASYLLYPFSPYDFGINLFALSPLEWSTTAALLDGILLVIWIAYLEFKHKISDLI